MSEEPILVGVSGGVATVTLNRPGQMNALDMATKVDLLAVLQRIQSQPEVRAVVLAVTGRAFCVGQDLREFLIQRDQCDVEALFRTVGDHFGPITEALATMHKPVVAAIQGAAAGAGLSLALAADFRIASPEATFTTAFSAIGLSPDTGMSWYLPRLVGSAKALELLMLSPTLSAEEALALGLVNEVVAPEGLAASARELADRLASGPTLAFARIRELVRGSGRLSLQEALAGEHQAIIDTGGSEDHDGAIRAFVRKERAAFHGR
jgi:2-(1,2-epoxy-1,2-dihydrophenyl)acetyl-CoA isomerase